MLEKTKKHANSLAEAHEHISLTTLSTIQLLHLQVAHLHHETEVLIDLRQEKDAREEERGGDREEQLGQEERFLLSNVSCHSSVIVGGQERK